MPTWEESWQQPRRPGSRAPGEVSGVSGGETAKTRDVEGPPCFLHGWGLPVEEGPAGGRQAQGWAQGGRKEQGDN